MKVKVLSQSQFSDLWLLANQVFEVKENNEGEIAIQPDNNDPLKWYLKPNEYEIVEA